MRVFEQGLMRSQFGGKAVNDNKCGYFPAVHAEVTGHAYYTGTSVFTAEKDDLFRNGFLLRKPQIIDTNDKYCSCSKLLF